MFHSKVGVCDSGSGPSVELEMMKTGGEAHFCSVVTQLENHDDDLVKWHSEKSGGQLLLCNMAQMIIVFLLCIQYITLPPEGSIFTGKTFLAMSLLITR